jgi:hypothetical protein
MHIVSISRTAVPAVFIIVKSVEDGVSMNRGTGGTPVLLLPEKKTLPVIPAIC